MEEVKRKWTGKQGIEKQWQKQSKCKGFSYTRSSEAGSAWTVYTQRTVCHRGKLPILINCELKRMSVLPSWMSHKSVHKTPLHTIVLLKVVKYCVHDFGTLEVKKCRKLNFLLTAADDTSRFLPLFSYNYSINAVFLFGWSWKCTGSCFNLLKWLFLELQANKQVNFNWKENKRQNI